MGDESRIYTAASGSLSLTGGNRTIITSKLLVELTDYLPQSRRGNLPKEVTVML